MQLSVVSHGSTFLMMCYGH